ncbi:MAG: SAM-dependent methyltransferase [Bacteroidaceae bacterium]|nr:SAM-dependent methyltransferase [Bacteroidaceae bacterium]
MEAALYLIPSLLGETPVDRVIPTYNKTVIKGIRYFVVENVRSARRFLKSVDRSIDIDQLNFSVLDVRTKPGEVSEMLAPLEAGNPIGVISEAGCPAVADPGADIVDKAQRKGLKVVPLVGPSSIILSVMASGFNGQSFAFNGYLPIGQNERVKSLRQLEQRAVTLNQTQIFIETPYRNSNMMQDILNVCCSSTRVCVASNLTCDDEWVRTKSVREWRAEKPDLPKVPTIFLIYR